MTGLERNADVVHMATYAPLFAHVEGWQWRPDLIWYDNLNSFRTVSWHVQQLYGQYKGRNTLKVQMDGRNVTGADGQNGLFASSVVDGSKIYVKVVNTTDRAQELTLNFTGLKKKQTVSAVTRINLTCTDLYKDNSLDDPCLIVPSEAPFAGQGQSIDTTIDPYCFTVFVLER